MCPMILQYTVDLTTNHTMLQNLQEKEGIKLQLTRALQRSVSGSKQNTFTVGDETKSKP